MSNADKFRDLNKELQKLLNRKQYLEGWLNQRDVAGDLSEYGELCSTIWDIRKEMERLINKRVS